MTAFAIHVILWRFRVPQREGRILAVVFLFVLVAGLTAYELAVGSQNLSPLPLLRLALAVFFYCSLCTFYFILFTAVEADSPTLTMIELIFKERTQGLAREDLLRIMSGHSFANVRLDQLQRDNMVIVDGEKLRPTHKGRLVTQLILSYRRLLGRSQAGG